MRALSSAIIGSSLSGRDGSVGSVSDLLFDDGLWTIRWAVVDTGRWLPGRKVLVIPSVLRPSAVSTAEFEIDLDREQMRQSPSLADDAPVSRQHEAALLRYYNWPPYWKPADSFAPAPKAVPLLPNEGIDEQTPAVETRQSGDPRLRSIAECTGYRIAASDDDVGHVDDFVVDKDTWTIRLLVVDTRNWLPGRRVLLSPEWITDIDWPSRHIKVSLTKAELEGSPEVDEREVIDAEHERRLYRHYGFNPRWTRV